jgi:hypothetical protein
MTAGFLRADEIADDVFMSEREAELLRGDGAKDSLDGGG